MLNFTIQINGRLLVLGFYIIFGAYLSSKLLCSSKIILGLQICQIKKLQFRELIINCIKYQ